MAAARKPISKRVRFEVFKRDSFTCQYCGAHPPATILHADHIHPVSKGGSNDQDNLITACVECNLGKSNHSLEDAPKSLKEKAAEIVEREAQIAGYQEITAARRRRIDAEVEEIVALYEDLNPGYTMTDRSILTTRRFVEELGFDEVYEALQLAWSRARSGSNGQFKYFCGICWNKIRGPSNGN